MSPNDDEPIWYVAYGSNCRRERFEAYLTGGRADGATRQENGARDPRPPARSEPFWFPHGVRFVGNSAKWGGGGVAFLDHEPGGRAPGRRYLITRGQFDDVAAQESRRAATPMPVDQLVAGSVTALGDGFYDGLLAFPPIDGIPVVTFTSPRPPTSRPPNPPSAPYLGTILRGLLEVHDEPVESLVAALMAAPGIAAGWTTAEVVALASK
ncbi:MAG: hypothetical protein RIB98_12345 [Acidimicrobiales bacterium]